MNRRRYRVGGFVVALAVTMLPAALPSPTLAQTSDDQKQIVEQLTDQIEALEQKSDILAEDYVTAVDEKNQLDAEVAAAEQRVAEKQAAVEALRAQLADVAVQAYMGAATNGFGPMFSSSTEVTDGLARDQLARVAVSAGTATTDDFDQAVKDLEAEQKNLDEARDAPRRRPSTSRRRRKPPTPRRPRPPRLASPPRPSTRTSSARRRRSGPASRTCPEGRRGSSRGAAGAGAGQRRSRPAARRGQRRAVAVAVAAAAAAEAAPRRWPAPRPLTGAVPQASSRAGTAVAAALAQQGVPYRFASSQPGVAFDCSGLTAYAWAQAGVSLPHQSRAQQGSVPNIPVSQAQPGDLLFFYSPISHVSIYLGGGQHVHAPNSGTVVSVASVNWSNVVAVGRPG